jgi:hypothetical protein
MMTHTRWNASDQAELAGCDRPPQLRRRSHEEYQSQQQQQQQQQQQASMTEDESNIKTTMVKAQSESHLSLTTAHTTVHPTTTKWKPNGTAAGVDRPPTLKHVSSFGSSALFNASFPLRSRSGDMNEPLLSFPFRSRSGGSEDLNEMPITPPSPPQRLRSSSSRNRRHEEQEQNRSSSPSFPSSSNDDCLPSADSTPYYKKTKDDSIVFSTTAMNNKPLSGWFDKNTDLVQKQSQDLVSIMDLTGLCNHSNNAIKNMTSSRILRTSSCDGTMLARSSTNPSIVLLTRTLSWQPPTAPSQHDHAHHHHHHHHHRTASSLSSPSTSVSAATCNDDMTTTTYGIVASAMALVNEMRSASGGSGEQQQV